MLGFYYFDYELRYDLIPVIESKYNVYANIKDTSIKGIEYNRMHRAIAGLSMGGMQVLNLIVGGYRCDSTVYTGRKSKWNNGLDTTFLASGMKDLFTYIGAFSNAPTSSDGKVLSNSIASSEYSLNLLYVTCGDADEIAGEDGYGKAVNGIEKDTSGKLRNCYQVIIKDGIHDFNVWNNGAYNFIRLAFGKIEEISKLRIVKVTLDS